MSKSKDISNSVSSFKGDDVSLFDYDFVYRIVDSFSLSQVYYLLSILPDVFSRKFFNASLCSENLSDRFVHYSNVISSLHDNLHVLSNSELTRLRLYIDRLVFKARIKSDDDFINQLLDDVSPSNNKTKTKYEKSKKIR